MSTWICPKCGHGYNPPLPAIAMAHKCLKVGGQVVEMKEEAE